MITESPYCPFCKKRFSKEIYYLEHMAKKSPCCRASEEHIEMEIKRKKEIELEIKRNINLNHLLEIKRIKDEKDSEKFQKKFQTERKQGKLFNIFAKLFGKKKSKEKNYICNDDYMLLEDVYD
jgi:acetyl-CoA carboxylase beta subunit